MSKPIIDIDVSDFADFGESLGRLKEKAWPYAVRGTLNTVAFDTSREWRRQIENGDLQVRNTFTVRAITVDKATGTNIMNMRSTVSAPKAPWLEKLETGGIEERGNVPTGSAAGAGLSKPKRKRALGKNATLASVTLAPRVTRGSRRQRNRVAVKMAVASGRKLVFLDLGKRRGVFKVMGSKSNPQVRMLFDTSKPSHQVKKHATLGPAVRLVTPRLAKIMKAEVDKQIKLHKAWNK